MASCTPVIEVSPLHKEPPQVHSDVDAAHARLRSHQSSLESINSRVDVNERRIDRIERRVDDQSSILADLRATAHATKSEVEAQTGVALRAAARIEDMIDRLNQHIAVETAQEHEQTVKIERLHRTMIRVATVVAVFAMVMGAFVQQSDLVDYLKMILG